MTFARRCRGSHLDAAVHGLYWPSGSLLRAAASPEDKQP
jgi:hypothetical protein